MANPFTGKTAPNPFFQQAYEFAENLLDKLAEIHTAIDYASARKERARISQAGESTELGVAEVIFTSPPGWEWLLERVGLTAPAGASCNAFLDSAAPQNLLEVITRAESYADAFSNNIYIPQGRRVVFQFTGCGARREVFVGLQLSRFSPPNYKAMRTYDVQSA